MEIKLINVTKSLKGTNVLEDINLELHNGFIYGLWGQNGSGKTMLLRILSGLIYPTKGMISVDGKRLGKEITFPPSVGLLLENPAFLSQYTGRRNLQLIASVKQKIADLEIDLALHKVGLNPQDKRVYRKYSLGMKQRLGLAAAIMEEPELLLLDEPTNALDERGVEELEMLLLGERSRGGLLVVASHDKEFLNRISDQIFQMADGHLVEDV